MKVSKLIVQRNVSIPLDALRRRRSSDGMTIEFDLSGLDATMENGIIYFDSVVSIETTPSYVNTTVKKTAIVVSPGWIIEGPEDVEQKQNTKKAETVKTAKRKKPEMH